jgi:hypothetical protein
MDTTLEKDPTLRADQEKTPPTKRFAALADAADATYPMLAPAAAVPLGHEEDAFDEQILAGLVNV